VAQLYREPTTLARSVCLFVTSGLARGECVQVVATPATRRALQRGLAREGLRLPTLVRSGRLAIVDAAETLPRILKGGTPDPDRFEAVIGSDVRKAIVRHGGRLRLYGEMVNLLWRDNLAAAIRLEQLWVALLASSPIAMLCGYGLDCFDPHAYRGPLQGIASVHSHLLPTGNAARFDRAVGRALDDVFGTRTSPIRKLLQATLRSGGRPSALMPPGGETLFRLSELLPILAQSVLPRVRLHYQGTMRPEVV
jgi:hypothetical protein